MQTHAHYSKATIKGHPIHVMLVGFPIAFYSGGLASAIAFSATQDGFWLRASMILLLAGVIGGLIAAVFGAIDLFAGIPRNTVARRTGLLHASLNVTNLVLFASMAGALYGKWSAWDGLATLHVGGPIVLGVVGFVALLGAGALGWSLVQTHHVGVDERVTPDGVAAPRT